MLCNVNVQVFVIMKFVYVQVNGTQACICIGNFKHHYGGSFTGYIMIYGFVYRNGSDNVRKSGKRVLVSCRAPSLCLGGGRGVTWFA